MRLQFAPYILEFKEPAGTSRGVLTRKLTAFLKVFDENNPDVYGIGEAAIFEGLSPEADERYFYKVVELSTNLRLGLPTDLSHFPSLQFGFEQALIDFTSGGKGIYFPSDFTLGKSSIQINGLIWMGNFEEMRRRLDSKLEQGYQCIKIKIGAIDWQQELSLLELIRKRYTPDQVEIRVDANGAFSTNDALKRLEELARYSIHSIEQPIRQGQPDEMATLCRLSPVPIALDEELIGKFTTEAKIAMLEEIRPQYIVIKPSLTGGFSGASEWITLAQQREIGWWITSALESNVGLTALSQWVAALPTTMAQGLGTGALFTNNIPSALYIEGQNLRYNPSLSLSREAIANLDWRD
ncbi:MAG: o-succinylbenzoate synthase [Bacteroidales bacterium]|nr:o-succinylbenzoate synthase [Bacteroidales bacterium]